MQLQATDHGERLLETMPPETQSKTAHEELDGLLFKTQSLEKHLLSFEEKLDNNSVARNLYETGRASVHDAQRRYKTRIRFVRIASSRNERKALKEESTALLRAVWRVMLRLGRRHPALREHRREWETLMREFPEDWHERCEEGLTIDFLSDLGGLFNRAKRALEEAEEKRLPEVIIGRTPEVTAPEPKLSQRDTDLCEFLTADYIALVSNPDIIKTRLDELNRHPTFKKKDGFEKQSLRSALNRIRIAKQLPSSSSLRNRRSPSRVINPTS